MTEEKRKILVLIACGTALAMGFIDQSAINVALPSIQRALNLPEISMQWIINAYLLALAAFVVFGGKLGDRIGKRTTFIAGVSTFTFASMTCALAPTGWWLILSRGLQGIGGALMIPNSSAIVVNSFPDNERGRATGILVSGAAFFLAVGPLIGGVLTQYLSWRFIFWINLPIAIVGIASTFAVIEKDTPSRKSKIDWIGFGLLTTWMFLVIFSLMESSEFGWLSPLVLSMLLGAILLLILFIFYEKKHSNPFIDLNLLHNSTYTRAILIFGFAQAAFIAPVFWAVFVQNVLRFSPSIAGLLVLPAVLPMMLSSSYAGRLRDRHGPRLPLLAGSILAMIGSLWIAVFCWRHDYLLLFFGFACFGTAGPFLFATAGTTATASAEPAKRGIAAGMASGMRQLGGAVGMALSGAMMTNLAHLSLSKFIEQAKGNIQQLSPQSIQGLLAGSSTAKQAISSLSSEAKTAAYHAAIHAYTLGFSAAMLFIAGFSAACFCLAFKLRLTNN